MTSVSQLSEEFEVPLKGGMTSFRGSAVVSISAVFNSHDYADSNIMNTFDHANAVDFEYALVEPVAFFGNTVGSSDGPRWSHEWQTAGLVE